MTSLDHIKFGTWALIIVAASTIVIIWNYARTTGVLLSAFAGPVALDPLNETEGPGIFAGFKLRAPTFTPLGLSLSLNPFPYQPSAPNPWITKGGGAEASRAPGQGEPNNLFTFH
ncbi:MAG: hypothetical protein ACREBU_01475 [Nitrososphaera sp.]